MESNSSLISILYFNFLVIFGSFFLLNLILAAIMESFDK